MRFFYRGLSLYIARESIALLAAAAVAMSACGQSPTAPGSPPGGTEIQTPPGPNDLTGTAYEFTVSGERRPVANLRLNVRSGGPTDGPFGGIELPDVVTDRNGRYVIRDVTVPLLFVETAPGSQYRFLCRYHPMIAAARFFPPAGPLLDLPVVHMTWLGDRVPPGMWVVGTSVSGTVSERQGETLQAIAGATVTLDSSEQNPPATTNAAGFYMVCSVVGTDVYRTISAEKPGYRTATRQIFGGWDYVADFELLRE